ncbi:hypothetical protein KKE26_07860, partial [bacterium]|nr:hypothetical protein [bacterium]
RIQETGVRSQNSEYRYRGRATKGVNSKKCTLVLLTFPKIFTPFCGSFPCNRLHVVNCDLQHPQIIEQLLFDYSEQL